MLGRTIGDPYGNRTEVNGGPSIAAKYVSALYYSLTSLTTIGFGNIAPNTTAEKLFGCVTMLLGGGCIRHFIFVYVRFLHSEAQFFCHCSYINGFASTDHVYISYELNWSFDA